METLDYYLKHQFNFKRVLFGKNINESHLNHSVVTSNEKVAFCHVLDDAAMNLTGTLCKNNTYETIASELQRQSIVEQIENVSYKKKNDFLHPETAAISAIIDKRWNMLIADQGNKILKIRIKYSIFRLFAFNKFNICATYTHRY